MKKFEIKGLVIVILAVFLVAGLSYGLSKQKNIGAYKIAEDEGITSGDFKKKTKDEKINTLLAKYEAELTEKEANDIARQEAEEAQAQAQEDRKNAIIEEMKAKGYKADGGLSDWEKFWKERNIENWKIKASEFANGIEDKEGNLIRPPKTLDDLIGYYVKYNR